MFPAFLFHIGARAVVDQCMLASLASMETHTVDE